MTKLPPAASTELLQANPATHQDLSRLKRRLAKKFHLPLPLNSDLIAAIKNSHADKPNLLSLLTKRSVRTLSGVAPVAVLTAPFKCPGRCVYCPQEKGLPRSYLKNEPAVSRALHCHFNPYQQIQYRLSALTANGHQPTKIELIIIGGTWSALPMEYQIWFVAECFRAANDYEKNVKQRTVNQQTPLAKLRQQLLLAQKNNETARHQIVGVTVETRPDHITPDELWRLRALGVTRVELGAQILDDKILRLNRRDDTVAGIRQATAKLKNFGFKVTYHFMPALPGSAPAHDLKMFQAMFSPDQDTAELKITARVSKAKWQSFIRLPLQANDFNPDQIKFYPTVVTKGSLLYHWWQGGRYQPYADNELKNLIVACKKIIPPYVRIIRLIRDIPVADIVAGNKLANLRQLLAQAGTRCRCIRCREVGQAAFQARQAKLFVIKYRANEGDEYFINFSSADKSQLYGFARLRLGQDGPFAQTAWLRELHVYGRLITKGQRGRGAQHRGLGKLLVCQAETIACLAGYRQLAVIAGVGVRDYYRKLGYHLRQTYLIKKLKP